MAAAPLGPLSVLLGVLAGLGGLVSLYFVLVTYRLIAADPRWLPRFCRMDKDTCARVVDTPYARLMGVPNAVYGLLFYLAIIGVAVDFWAGGGVILCPLALATATIALLYSLWLAYALVVRLRTPCVLCFAGHSINAALWALLAIACGRLA